MFGKNAIAKERPPSEGFLVNDIFYTIQGEGPWAGRPTIFVRFTGCNLRCFWCDTEFEKGQPYDVYGLIAELTKRSQLHKCPNFVLTGGEPLLQCIPLLMEEAPLDWRFQVETAGTVWPAGLEQAIEDERLTLVCSPKTGNVHAMVKANTLFWKYIVSADDLGSPDGLPNMSTQVRGKVLPLYRPSAADLEEDPVIYVQPRDDQDAEANARNLEAAATIAMRHGYRLSVQVHKLVGLP